MTAWALVLVAGLAAAASAAWPRRRREEVRDMRWFNDPETGLREWMATPWMQEDGRGRR